MSAVLKGIGWVASKVFSRYGLMAGGAAYLYDKGQEKEEDKIGAEKLVEETLLPIAKNFGGTMMKGGKNIATDIMENTGAQDAVRSAASATESGLSAIPGVVSTAGEAVPKVTGAAGEVVSTVGEVGHSGVKSFMEKIVPKDWVGWATTAAIAVGGLLGLKTGIAGTTAQNLAGAILGVPMNALGAVGSSLLGGVTSLIPLGVAAVAVGYMVHPGFRSSINDFFSGINNTFSSKGSPEPTPEHGHSPAPVVPSPAPAVAPAADVSQLNVSGLNLDGVTGGITARPEDMVSLPRNPKPLSGKAAESSPMVNA